MNTKVLFSAVAFLAVANAINLQATAANGTEKDLFS